MIIVLDNTLTQLGILDNFNSFQCSLKYADAGNFVIKSLITDQTKKLLKIGNFVCYKDFAGIIESIQLDESLEEPSTIIASGLDITGLLSTRIIWNNFYEENKTELFLRKIVDENIINPINQSRKIPYLTLGSYNGLLQNTQRHTDNENILDECKKVCRVADYGFKIKLDLKKKEMKFEVYEGLDRTVETHEQIVIGREYDNVINQTFTISSKEEKTTALVKSENMIVSVGEEITGFNRKEVFVDSSQAQEEMTREQLEKTLKSQGKEALKPRVECLDIDLGKVNLNLGDKISIRDKEWNLNISKRVTEKQITLENGVETITFILGEDIQIKEIK